MIQYDSVTSRFSSHYESNR